MRVKLTYRIFTLFMLCLFMLNTVPREFIHSFANHKDTIDKPSHSDRQVSKEHIHCNFLRIPLFHYVAKEPVHIEKSERLFREITSAVIPVYHYYFVPSVLLRGPPAIA